MSICKYGITRLLAVAALFGAAFTSYAQLPGGAPGGINAALIKLFGDVTAFSAQTEVRVLDKSRQETLSVPMDFALLDKKIRVSLDLGSMKSKDMPPGTADALKQMGMARVISVVRPDKKLIHIIYPDQKCYLNMPMPPEEVEAMDKNPKVEKTELGKETLDGHPCVKMKVVIGGGDKGPPVEATTWNANDLKNFPIQIQTEEKGNTTVLRFKQVQLIKPEAKDFELPEGYKQYNDQQELIFGIMKNAAVGGDKTAGGDKQ
jgi:hypothetical protein